jgi:MoaA/NifB/PqqE/SkfB family radical SAM enzyme
MLRWVTVQRHLQKARRRAAGYLQQSADRARDAHAWAAARRAYGLSLRLEPIRPLIWVQYGHALKESGTPERALQAYRQATLYDPALADAQFHLGELLRAMGRISEAIPALESAALLDASFTGARQVSIQYRRQNRPAVPGLPAQLRYLNLGTTNVCNASCIHCPTNKASTDHIQRQPMTLELHRKLFLGLYELGLPIHQIGFGLFGDSLVDPTLVERVKMARNLFPETEIVVNTNGAAFNPRKHQVLRDANVIVSLHCESLDSDTYDDLMQPLRAKRVFPKFQSILDAFPDRVNVSVPVNRRNAGELSLIRDWFMTRGARSVTFDPLVSRCVEDRTLFNSLAIRPGIVQCGPDVLEDFIVDSDGTVLLCCQDFERVEIIGDLKQETVLEALTSARRMAVNDLLAKGEHACMNTCSKCFGDYREGTEFLAVLPQ